MTLPRREFLRLAGAAGLAWTLPGCAQGAGRAPRLRLGVGADLHHDIVPDGAERLAALLDAARDFDADAVIQLGDFCQPIAANLPLLRRWRAAGMPQVDVLGNHDMDGGFSSDQTAAWMGLGSRYASRVLRGHRIITLDGNERPAGRKAAGYPRFIGPEQLAWLKSTLALDELPLVVCCHQGLDGIDAGIQNSAEVRALLEEANRRAGWPRVRLVLTGHHHLDYLVTIGGIPYLQVNSFSYNWTDKPSAGGRFPAEVERRYPYLRQVLVYDQPLFALVELTPAGGRVIGRKAGFVGGYGPREAGVAESYGGHPIVPVVSNREW